MTTELTTLHLGKLEQVIAQGDLSKLNETERTQYLFKVCDSLGLNPLTRPFQYIMLNGKLTLYATKDATEQLRRLYKISLTITSREVLDGVYVVTARAKNAEGREDESTGAMFTANLKGELLANAYMKAETKAKRRVTLSICGLGMLDETEVSTIPGAQVVHPDSVIPEKLRPYLAAPNGEGAFDAYESELAQVTQELSEEFKLNPNYPKPFGGKKVPKDTPISMMSDEDLRGAVDWVRSVKADDKYGDFIAHAEALIEQRERDRQAYVKEKLNP